jgi:hypothetical protein
VTASAIRFGEIRHGAQNAELTGLIVDVIKGKAMKRMATVMQAKQIDVPSMLRSNFVQAIHEIGYEYSENRPDATFVLELEQHGFDDRTVFSNMKVPFAVLLGKLVTADGKVIWRGNSQNGKDFLVGESANSMDASRKEIGVRNWEEYERDPEKLRADWELAVKGAVRDLLRAAKKAQHE